MFVEYERGMILCDCSLVDMAGCAPCCQSLVIAIMHCKIPQQCSSGCALYAAPYPQTYRGYSCLSMDKACEAVLTHKLSVRVAAEECGVSRSTLCDKVTGKVPVHAGQEWKETYLTDEEENRFVARVFGCVHVSGKHKISKTCARAANRTADLQCP